MDLPTLALLQNDISTYGQDASRLSEINVRTRFVAYTIDNYNPSAVTITLVQSATGPTRTSVYAATTIKHQWLDADWRIFAPPSGHWTASQIPSPSGHTPFPDQ